MDARADAKDRYCEATPPMPDAAEMPHDVRLVFEALPVGQIGKLFEWHPVRKWFNEGSAARKAWSDECDRLRVETGLSAASDAEYARMCEVDDVLRQIMAIRARTMQGLRLKVRVTQAAGLADCIGIDEEDLLPSLIADLDAMAGGQEAKS